MRRGANPSTVDEHMQAIYARLERLEKRRTPSYLELYVQPDEPMTTTVGALWFDTDEAVGA